MDESPQNLKPMLGAINWKIEYIIFTNDKTMVKACLRGDFI